MVRRHSSPYSSMVFIFVAFALILCCGITGARGEALATFSEFTSRDLLLARGEQCLTLRSEGSGLPQTASDAFFNPVTQRCTRCANNSINANTEYVVKQMSPVNYNVLEFLLKDKQAECICDMSKGLANGKYISNQRVLQRQNVISNMNSVVAPSIKQSPAMPAGTVTSVASPICTPCSAFGPFVPSIRMDEASGAQGCSSCGTVQQALLTLLESNTGTSFQTSNPTTFSGLVDSLRQGNLGATRGLFANATFDASYSLGACKCPSGYVITESLGSSVRLPFQICTLCRSGHVDARDPSVCHECVYPYVYDSTTRRCSMCADGYSMLPDGQCEVTSRLSLITSMQSGATSGTATGIIARNWENKGAGSYSGAFPSQIMAAHLNTAGSRCYGGKNETACQLLANLCVLASYDQTSAACKVYRGIQSLESCRGEDCETPSTVPWLYYLRSSTSIFQDVNFVQHVTLGESLRFVLNSYAWNGTWLGSEAVVTQLHNCEITPESALNFFTVGSQRNVECRLNIPYFVVAGETVFHELFVEADGGQLFPVPALLNFDSKKMTPESLAHRNVYRAAARGDLSPDENAYVRRFYMYDNIGGRAGSSQTSSGSGSSTGNAANSGGTAFNSASRRTAYVTYAYNVRVLCEIRPGQDSTIQVPLLIVQYTSRPADELYNLLEEDLMYESRTRLLKSIDTRDDNKIVAAANDLQNKFLFRASTSAAFVNENDIEQSLMITLIVCCCVCFCSSWVRTYAWMRRQQNALIGPETLLRWFVYFCNHLSITFAFTVVVTSWLLYLFFKNQASVSYMLPTDSKYLFAMLYTAVSCKGVVVMYRIFEQCNADVFVIDWERSKGQLLRENKQVPVSMWRSTFIANELNEMQTLRAWHPLFSMMCVLLFLEGLGYIHYARAVPYASLSASESTAPSNNILRIAVAGLFWFAITGGIYVLEYYFYYRFFKIHPLRAFVDLCSVSNISLMILLEPQWGFYIHGESIHAHSDISMVEFQENLRKESQGLMPARGLGGQDMCQTFEVFVGPNLRNYLWCAYAELAVEQGKSLANATGNVNANGAPTAPATQHRKCFDFLTGKPGYSKTFTDETMEVKHHINDAFTQSVRSAEKYLMNKFATHQYLDFPPNILFMNGPFANEEMMGKDLYFLDDFYHWGRFLLCGIDFDLFLFYVLMFFAIDTSLHNCYIAMVVVYCIDLIFVEYRGREGQANMGAKTLFDERFFL